MVKKEHYIGGQALVEGVLMKNKDKIGIAVRKGKKILVKREKLKFKDSNIIFLRGIKNLFIILHLGMKSLNYSTNVQLEKDEKIGFWGIFFSIIFALAFGLALFKLLPLFFTTLFDKYSAVNNIAFNIIEGLIKVTIFVLYVYLISLMKDVNRIFQYHGAEHKAVACYESNKKLIVKNVKKFDKEHKRCGTSFIFLVLLISVVVYSFIPKDYGFWLKFSLRIILLPVIAGISYEFLRLGAKYNLFGWLVYPGLWIQKITTKEPDNKQIEVAISALNAALK